MRSWLVRGTRKLAADPRRSRGGHGQARQLLAEDGRHAATTHDLWRGLVSALQRHTVHSALAQLSEGERQVLIWAYLEGHTNRQIAAMLSVSVSTVRRRLSIALEKLENHVRRAGTWVSSIALLGLTYVVKRTGSIERLGSAARSAGWPSLVALTAAGTMTAAAVGIAVINPGQAGVQPPSSLSISGLSPFSSLANRTSPLTGQGPSGPSTTSTGTAQPAGAVRASGQTGHSADPTANTDPGCDGNPTSAPPTVPVGSRTGHPAGAPVTHPTAGGCGPHGAEVP